MRVGLVLALWGLAGGCALDRAGLGSPDAGCAARAESCNGADDDCDGEVDEDYDLASDPSHCGTCGNACPADPNNAAAACARGACALLCDPGFGDCNESLSDGCEAVLADPASCGSCERACDPTAPLCQRDAAGAYACVAECAGGLSQCGSSCVDTLGDPLHCGSCDAACAMAPGSSARCTDGRCELECDPGLADCDRVASNGCETTPATDALHCGACDAACTLARATAACVGGSCAVDRCEGGFGDCDGTPANGCERDLRSDPARCGSCGNACDLPNTDVHTCAAGACGVGTCDAGFADCDRLASNGCEVGTLTDPMRCGGCAAACNLPHTDAHGCVGGSCTVGTCDAGFADCDGVASNGCEADLGSTATCGSCSSACSAPASCVGGRCVGGCTVTSACGTGAAACSCNAGCTCEFTCSANCTVTCATGSICTVGTTAAGLDVRYTCNAGAMCAFGARRASNARITCNGTTCSIDCTNASNCDRVDCQGAGADCRIECMGASNCGYETCTGMTGSCGTVRTCNPTGACS